MREYHKHGMTHDRLYQIWCDMKQRCYNPKVREYKNYGGRGITVCDEWMNSAAFFEWAKANGYSEKLTIDRIDNDKGYSPDNCRWSTAKEQRHNQRPRKSKSGFTGIRIAPNGFIAYVCTGRKYNHIGTYNTINEAIQKREEFIRRNNL